MIEQGSAAEAGGREIKTVSVFGSSTTLETSDEYEIARRLGRLLAEAGYEVVNGGQLGTMDGVARGCSEAGGRCVGITVRDAPWGEQTGHAAELVELDDLLLRTRELLLRGDAWVALPGQVGTLAEVSMAWAMMAGRLLEPRPLILLGEPWRRAIEHVQRLLGIRSSLVDLLAFESTPEQVLSRLGR